MTKRLNNRFKMPLMMRGTGMVKTQDKTMRLAVTHFTDFTPSVRPTPITPPVMVCVVLTGIPMNEVAINVVAPANSAEKPLMGVIFAKPPPMVLMTFLPPIKMPNDMMM